MRGFCLLLLVSCASPPDEPAPADGGTGPLGLHESWTACQLIGGLDGVLVTYRDLDAPFCATFAFVHPQTERTSLVITPDWSLESATWSGTGACQRFGGDGQITVVSGTVSLLPPSTLPDRIAIELTGSLDGIDGGTGPTRRFTNDDLVIGGGCR